MEWNAAGRVRMRACLLLAACVALHAAVAGAQNAKWGADYFPNVTLTTHEGVKVRFYDDLIKGKIVAVNLMYTSCKYACPLETARLAQVQKLVGERMGRDVFFYSISIDPEFDTPPVLKAYAEKFRAGPGWLFLTGKREDIDLISRKTGLYSPPNPGNPDGHTPHLLVGNELTGQWMRNSALDNPRFLASTIANWLNSWRTAEKPAKSYAEVPKVTMDPGEYMFKLKCTPCHSIGGGDGLGPDLLGVTAKRSRLWLARMIQSPEALNAEGDATAKGLREKYSQVRMPRLGLGDADVAALISFIERKSAAPRAAPARPSAGSTPHPQLRKIVDAYLQLHQTLHAGTTAGHALPARTIVAAAATMGARGQAIRAAAGAFPAGSSLVAARDAFGRLGDEIMLYAQQERASFGDGVRIAWCPMVQRYWLQRGDRIQNPFHGSEMSECGRFVTAIPSLNSK